MAFRDALGERLAGRGVFLAATVVTFLLAGAGGIAALAGMALCVLTLWARRWDWVFFGLARPRWREELARATGYALAIIVLVDLVAQPLVERALGERIDLSALGFLHGNSLAFIGLTLFMWVFAAGGEELFFRGYLMKGWPRCFGNMRGDSRGYWLAGAVVSSLLFSLFHLYQGVAGVINTALVGAVLAVQFYRRRDSLASCMMTHGLYDTVGLAQLYLFGRMLY